MELLEAKQEASARVMVLQCISYLSFFFFFFG